MPHDQIVQLLLPIAGIYLAILTGFLAMVPQAEKFARYLITPTRHLRYFTTLLAVYIGMEMIASYGFLITMVPGDIRLKIPETLSLHEGVEFCFGVFLVWFLWSMRAPLSELQDTFERYDEWNQGRFVSISIL